MSDAIEPLLVTLADARRLLAVGKAKLNYLCNAGELERTYVGTHAVITYASIKAFIDRLTKKT